MKFYRIHYNGRIMIWLIAGITIEAGELRMYSTASGVERLYRVFTESFRDADAAGPVCVTSKDGAAGYLSVRASCVSIEEVSVTSVLPLVN